MRHEFSHPDAGAYTNGPPLDDAIVPTATIPVLSLILSPYTFEKRFEQGSISISPLRSTREISRLRYWAQSVARRTRTASQVLSGREDASSKRSRKHQIGGYTFESPLDLHVQSSEIPIHDPGTFTSVVDCCKKTIAVIASGCICLQGRVAKFFY